MIANSFSIYGSNSSTIQWNLDLRKPDLRKNLDLRKIVATTNFLALMSFDGPVGSINRHEIKGPSKDMRFLGPSKDMRF